MNEENGVNHYRIAGYSGLLPNTAIAYDDFTTKFTNRIGFCILTHFHADHYEGLHSNYNGPPIYCSTVTKRLILQRWQISADKVQNSPSLPFYSPQIINLPIQIVGLKLRTIYNVPYFDGSNEHCTIELFDANHCPGAAMFLLTGYFGSYFLSGDLRYCASMGEKLTARKLSTIPIDCLLLDCTFSDPVYQFPSQKQSVKQILHLIANQPEQTEVFLEAEMLGLEQILVAIAKAYSTKIHVTEKKSNQLHVMPSLAKYFTTKGNQSRFHVCPFKSFKAREIERSTGRVPTTHRSREESTTPNREDDELACPSLFIKPSTMWFCANRNQNTNLVPFHSKPVLAKDAWHVLYSVHSSYLELKQFIQVIKPRKVIPWTDCSSVLLEEVSHMLDPSPSKPISIPLEVLGKFPFLQNGIPPTHQPTQPVRPPNKEEIELTCWSPSPPRSPSHSNSGSESDCIIIELPTEDFTKQTIKQKEKGDAKNDPAIGW